jgi:hypothetical protein
MSALLSALSPYVRYKQHAFAPCDHDNGTRIETSQPGRGQPWKFVKRREWRRSEADDLDNVEYQAVEQLIIVSRSILNRYNIPG